METGLLANLGNAEASADLAREVVANFGMTRNSFGGAGGWIGPEGVRRPFAFQGTAVSA